jgi:hypothetical protein
LKELGHVEPDGQGRPAAQATYRDGDQQVISEDHAGCGGDEHGAADDDEDH